MKYIIALVVLIFSEFSFARNLDSSLKFLSAESKNNYCEGRNTSELIKERFYNTDERLSFSNGEYGLAGGGVCWWHTRFQRNAIYLANYEPSQPKPSLEEAKKIIKEIRSGRRIVNIPGFSTLKEFSAAYESEIISELENWQLVDSFINQRWIQGLSGQTQSASGMKTQMDKMYERVEEKGQLTYAKLQLPGVTAHAMLVGEMEKTQTGYILKVIDSNSSGEIQTYEYKEGDENFLLSPGIVDSEDPFVPYVEFTNEADRLQTIVSSTCGGFNVEEDSSSCSSPEALDGDDFSSNYIFDPSQLNLDYTSLGESRTFNSRASECSSRGTNEKNDLYESSIGNSRGSSGSPQ